MSHDAKIEFSAEVSPTGDWQATFSDYIGSGLHSLVVTDEFDSEDSILLFTQETRVNVEGETVPTEFEGQATVVHQIETINEVVPAGFIAASIVVASVFSIYAIGNFLAAKKIQKLANGNSTKLPKIMMIASLVLLVATTVTGAYIGIRSGTAENLVEKIFTPEKARVIVAPRTGSVRDPISLEPVSDVELSAGEVTVKTDVGGQFIFQALRGGDNIRINHPDLKRTVQISSDDTNGVDIFFNADLYNTIITVTDSQAKGEFGKIHSLLEPKNRAELSQEELIDSFRDTYKPTDVDFRILTISSVKRITEVTLKGVGQIYLNVIRVTMDNQGKIEVYDFVQDGEDWWLIRE